MKIEVLTENVRIELPMGNLGLAVTQPAGGSNTIQHYSTLLKHFNATQLNTQHYSNTLPTNTSTQTLFNPTTSRRLKHYSTLNHY